MERQVRIQAIGVIATSLVNAPMQLKDSDLEEVELL